MSIVGTFGGLHENVNKKRRIQPKIIPIPRRSIIKVLDSLSLIIPAYNEEKRLPATLAKLRSFLATHPFPFVEILIVNDGSRDQTAALVRAASADDPRFRLLENPGNRGKGYAVRHGMLEAKGDWALITDADLSTPIEEVLNLYAAAQAATAPIAFGSRAVDRSRVTVHQSFAREASGRFFNAVMRLATGLPHRDTQCGFKLFARPAYQAIFSRQLLEGFGFDVEILYIANLLGHQAVEVPVAWANVEGTKVSLLNGLDAFIDIYRVRRNHLRGSYR